MPDTTASNKSTPTAFTQIVFIPCTNFLARVCKRPADREFEIFLLILIYLAIFSSLAIFSVIYSHMFYKEHLAFHIRKFLLLSSFFQLLKIVAEIAQLCSTLKLLVELTLWTICALPIGVRVLPTYL